MTNNDSFEEEICLIDSLIDNDEQDSARALLYIIANRRVI